MDRSILGKFAHFADYYDQLWQMGLNKDTIDAVWRTATQSIDVEEAYQRARVVMPVYCDKLYAEWLAGGHDPDNLRDHFRAIAKEQPQPGPGPQPPSGPWKPPAASGEICRLPGPFFMSGMRMPNGLLLGTYRPAKLYLWNGAFHEVLSGPQESFYSFYMPPDSLPLVTTECPAGVWKMKPDGSFEKRWQSELGLSLAFDIHPIAGGLSLFTLDRFGGHVITMIKSVDNGLTWSTYKGVGGHLIQAYSDGTKELLIGERDRYPYICDLNGTKVMQDKAYKDQIINFACYHKGVAVLGCNNIDPLIHDGTRRNGYLTYFDGNNHIAGIDLKPPFIMNIKQDAEKEYVYAVASIWNETGYPNPELVRSKDGRKWEQIGSVPFPSVQTIEIADGGVYCYGGAYGQFGAVYFHKL